MLGFLVGAAGGAMGMVFLHRRNETQGSIAPGSARSQSGPEMKPGNPSRVFIFDCSSAKACAAARKMQFRSFELDRNISTLPLKDCDRRDKCQCKLREIEEKRRRVRRRKHERRQEIRFEPGKPAKTERRVNPGRRASDVAWVKDN